jgi:hypothetical protein
MLYKPTYKPMTISDFSSFPLLILFLELNEALSFLYGKPLVLEGIDEQVSVLLLHIKSSFLIYIPTLRF